MIVTKYQARHLIWAMLALVMAVIIAAFARQKLSPRPPALPVYWPIADFTLTNQNAMPIRLADLAGKVWVADVIFTRCAGPCPKMTRLLSEIQQALPADTEVRLITLTTDPEADTPAVLSRYAANFRADPKRWWFLTGTKEQMRKMNVDNLKFTAVEKDPPQRETEADLFIHSTSFLIVDRQGRLRSVVEAMEPGGREQVLAVIQRLLRE